MYTDICDQQGMLNLIRVLRMPSHEANGERQGNNLQPFVASRTGNDLSRAIFRVDPMNETVQRRFGDRVLSLHGPTIRLLELLGALARVSVGGSRNFRHGVRSSSDICRF